MTERDEATMPDTPEKAHGDALQEIVDSEQGDAADQPEDDQTA